MRRTIFITGGGSGIGRATAIRFAAAGWRTGLGDIDAAGMAATAALLPDGAECHRFDTSDPAGWDVALAGFARAAGGVDVLFNNAGIAAGGVFADTDAATIARVVAVNLTGVLLGARAAHPYLKARGGCLLNMASAAGLYGTAGAALYSATKAGVRGLSESLDGEWAADGIRVAVLTPGFIDTPLLDGTLTGVPGTIRREVRAGGLEITPVEAVANAAWDAVHGTALVVPVGATARRMRFAARWLPGLLRREMRARARR